MKTFLLTPVMLMTLLSPAAFAQTAKSNTPIDSLANFNQKQWTDFYLSNHISINDLPEFIYAQQRDYIQHTFFSSQRNQGTPPSPQQACTNIDFESGNLTGWNTSTGYNPLYNSIGCCSSAGGAQIITSGTGNDLCGGFSTVAPGGNFSVRLGNNGTGGIADRLEQTFMVTSSNANFTYKYAVVLEDPGHSLADQPKFEIEMIDSNGIQVPCTYYSVAAGQNIPGFLNSTNCANVVYKPWTSVSVDLTSLIGQNVTIRFTTYDCALGGHYAYAYIDGSCMNFNITQNTTLCHGSVIQLTAPIGFANYNWTLPNGTSASGQILTTGLAGAYTLNLTTVTGCPGPTLSYFLIESPKPNAYFAPNQLTACTQTVSFINLSTVTSGNITNNVWDFGNGNTSTFQNPTNYYMTSGLYNVQLIATTNMGCKDTAIVTVSINPLPTVVFTANNACLNSITSFTNTSSVTSGIISSVVWQFGDGIQSFLTQPSHQYANAGSYNVTLNVTSSSNCTNTITQQITVYPLPNVSFTANNVCQGLTTNYTNNTTIASGSITNYVWDFNSDGTPDNTSISPSNIFGSAGTYTSQLIAISNNNCVANHSVAVIVYPQPIAQFSSSAVCVGSSVQFNDLSSIAAGGQIVSYHWNFGDLGTSTIVNPSHTYSTYGSYNVTYTVISNHSCSNVVSNTTIVYPKPTVNFLSTTTCLNQATQFTNQSNIVSGSIIKYRWDFDNNGSIDDSTANPSHIYLAAGNPQSKLVAISNNNCINQIINPVTVHYNPVANFQAPSICLPNSTSFNNLSISSDGLITSYGWDFNGDNLIDNNQQNPQNTYSSSGNYGVKLEVQTQYGCVNTLLKSVFVNATPVVLFTAQNNVGCPSLCVNFTNNSTISNGSIVTYQWIFGDVSSPDYSQNPTHCYTTGNYNVTLKTVSDSGCVSSLTMTNLVNVYPTPIANFNITPAEVDITEPLIEVEDRSIGANTIKYEFSDGTIKNTPNFNHTFNTDVAKSVFIMQTVSNSYTCRDSIVKEVVIKPAYVIYVPNAFTPNSDGLNDGFKAVGVGIAQFKLEVFDRWGKLVFESDDINKGWDGSINGKGDFESTKQEVYVWKAKVTDVLQQKHDLIGHVTLLK
jgi:gliding motility-associated-like protein